MGTDTGVMPAAVMQDNMKFIKEIKEYYPKYLSLHQNPICRLLHVAGQLATLGTIALIIYGCMYLSLFFLFLIPVVPFVVYPFAWSGHFYFEKNKPAAFSKPIYAKICDWIMFFEILTFRIKFWK